jgi:pimeloyl-ACP methyl ester carboxylesterase
MWKEIYPPLAASGYQVIMYDRRGYGRSEKGADFPAFYVSDIFRTASVEDMAELLSGLHVESFHLVGQCEGGVIGVDYAGQYPDQVKTLTTSSTQCYSPVSMPEFNKEKFPNSFGELDPELREKLIDWHGEAHAESFFEMFRVEGGAYGTGYFDLRDGLARVQCPSLVLYPDRSFLFDVGQGVEFYRHLPKGELAVLPNCGHNTYEHQPAEYVRSVLSFLDRHGQ